MKMPNFKCSFKKTYPCGRDLRLLMNHVSLDETRPFLQGIYRSKHALIATDGRRLFITTHDALICSTDPLENKIIGNMKAISTMDHMSELKTYNNVIQGTYPKWEMIFRNMQDYKSVVSFKVPTWVKFLNKDLENNGTIGINLETDAITIGKSDIRNKDKLIYINIAYLSQYAGETVCFHIKDKTSAVIVTEDGAISFIDKIVAGEKELNRWFGVIMPLRV